MGTSSPAGTANRWPQLHCIPVFLLSVRRSGRYASAVSTAILRSVFVSFYLGFMPGLGLHFGYISSAVGNPDRVPVYSYSI